MFPEVEELLACEKSKGKVYPQIFPLFMYVCMNVCMYVCILIPIHSYQNTHVVTSDCILIFFPNNLISQTASLNTGFGHVSKRISEAGHNWKLLI